MREAFYTGVYVRNAKAYLDPTKRRALNEGGTSSSKTISILQLLNDIARQSKTPKLISVVSESFPHLKRGCMRDFKDKILGDDFDPRRWNASDSIYTYPKAKIEFFSADNPSKLRGARRDILYINECNNIPYEAYMELDMRTTRFTFLDWNPVSEFWAHSELMSKDENQYIHSTYLDAIDVLPPAVIANIENMKNDANWWNVYGLGLVGKIEGLVYPNFEICDEMPSEYSDRFFGLDFGYTDPTALVECRFGLNENSLYSNELIYQSGLTISDLLERLEAVGIAKGKDTIWADSASPEQIQELCRNGYDVRGCPKGADSVEFGHQKVRTFKQYWTKNSINCIKEIRNFRYIEDINGRLTDKTTHLFSHGMDARRYAVVGETGGLNIMEALEALVNRRQRNEE